MSAPPTTELFVYGTLRHDQPEHAKYCRGVTGWRPARMRAQLWRLPAGYRLATVPPGAVLLAATCDHAADEERRRAITPTEIGAVAPILKAAAAEWLDGEVLSFRDAAEAWPPLDRWEEFTPGGGGSYARVVLPVEIIHGGASRIAAVWVYAATAAPPGAASWTS